MKQYFNKIHYSECLNPEEKFLSGFLSYVSLGYLAGIKLRNLFYNINLIKKTRLPAYVISVGNITTGGTGKTPITAEIARYTREYYNKKVAVLSHGYGGRLSVKGVNLISDGKNIFSTPYLAGDEPYWMASNLNNIPVLTGRNRIKTGRYAIEKLGAEVLILDDGYQHIKLERNLNILVVDCNKRFGNNQLLPAGPLREPLSEIKRADKIIVVNKRPYDSDTDSTCLEFIENLKEKYNKPVYLCKFNCGNLFNIVSSKPLQSQKKAYAFAGIAQPEFFFNYLKNKNLELLHKREFSDHHLYTKEDLILMIQEAQKIGADFMATTEKDAVKITALINEIDLKIPIFALKLELDFDLDKFIGDSLSAYENSCCKI